VDPAGNAERSRPAPWIQSWTVLVPIGTMSGTSHAVHVPPAAEVGVTVALNLPLKLDVSDRLV